MMRPRKNKTNLPPCVYFKHGRHWYVKKGKWHKLSPDYAEALAEYARITSPKGEFTKLVRRTLEEAEIAPSTLKQYRLMAPRIEHGFQNFEPYQIKPRHIRQFLDQYRNRPAMSNRLHSLLKLVLTQAVNSGVIDHNPALEVPRAKERPRSRYLEDWEYLAIKVKARPYLGIMMDLAYLTGQRVMDVVSLKESQIQDGVIYFTQQKTGNRVKIEINDMIAAALDAARSLHRVRGTYLFHIGNGNPYSYYTISDAFSRARKAAGVKDAQFRDIRAKSATDADEAGLNASLLLGHSDPATTRRYLRKIRTMTAQGPGRVLDKPGEY